MQRVPPGTSPKVAGFDGRKQKKAEEQHQQQKEVKTIQRKMEIIRGASATGATILEFCIDYNKQNPQFPIDQTKISKWKTEAAREDWEGFLTWCDDRERSSRKRVPTWWRKTMNAEAISRGAKVDEVSFPCSLGRPSYEKHQLWRRCWRSSQP